MIIHSSMQLCGEGHRIECRSHSGRDWVDIRDGNQTITMEPKHVRALAAALDAYEGAAVDAAEPAEGV